MERDVGCDVVACAAKAKFSDLPESTVRIAKKFILDTIGVAIAGSTAPGCGEVASYIREIGGKKESSIIMFGYKVPNFHAAFVNGMMCHALDFDDTHEEAIVHANSTILPAALAMAESVGGVSGEEFLLAYVLGVDFACRIGLATGLKQGWHYTSVCGYFGSALTSSKILGLGEKETLNALGIAYSQVGGTHQVIVDTALVKRMHPGFAARGGVFSAMLAKRGITGSKGIFEGEFGFFNKYERGNAEILRKDLGKKFQLNQLSVKPYPSGMCTHGAITAALDLVTNHAIRSDDIDEIEVVASCYVHDLVGKPYEVKGDPQVYAQFSIPYTVAAAILRGKFGIEEIQKRMINDRRIQSLAKRVKCKRYESWNTFLVPVVVAIRLRNGTSFSRKVEVLKGNPANPTTEQEDKDKFSECVKFGAKKMSDEKRNKLIQLILNLESLQDMKGLAACLKF